jgi:peptide/nickel transport system substrate-binding protein
VVVAGAALALSLAACGGSSATGGGTSSAKAGQPVRGGIMNVVEEETAQDINPYPKGADAMATLEFNSLTYEQLLTTDADGNVVAGGRSLSTSFTKVSPTEVVAHIRPNVKFHDGATMTATDVAWTFLHAKDPATSYTPGETLLANLKSAVATSPTTVTFTLSAPDSGFVQVLASDQFPVVEKNWTQEHNGDLDKYPNGTGPFKVVSFVPNSDFKLTAFKDYWQKGLPYLNGVDVKTLPQVETGIAAVRSNQADIVEFPFDQGKLIGTLKNVTVHTAAPLLGEPLSLSCKIKPLNDVRVRQALLDAIDFNTIRTEVVPGNTYPLSYMIAPGFAKWGVAVGSEFPYAKQNIPEAKQLLAAAGYPNGISIPITVINNPAYAFNQRVVEMIAQQVAPAGIKVTIKPLDLATLLDEDFSGTLLADQSGLPINDDPDDYWANISAATPSGCTDAHIQSLMTQEKAATTDAARANLIKEIVVYAEQQAYNPILFGRPSRITVIQKDVEGYQPVPSIRWWSLRSAWKTTG